MPTGTTPFQYNNGDRKVQFRIVDERDNITAEQFRASIISNAQRIAGDPSRIAIVKDGGVTVSGKPWRFIEFTNQGQAAFVIFYFSNPGFGSVQLLFVSSVADVAERNALATPILKSVQIKPD